jgi:hypothetical protein
MPNADWYGLTYGNEKFVAIAMGLGAVYSTDGITWESMPMPSGAGWFRVTYGMGKFVSLSAGLAAGVAYWDGDTSTNWESTPLQSEMLSPWYGLTYGHGKFVAVTAVYDKAAYSADGESWTLTSMPAASWSSVAASTE